jgi:LPXTG-motif cell wall-anchored protein
MLRSSSGHSGRDPLPADGVRRRLAAAGLAFGLVALPGLLYAPAAMADETTATAAADPASSSGEAGTAEDAPAEKSAASPAAEEPAPSVEEPAPAADEPAPAPADESAGPGATAEQPAEAPAAGEAAPGETPAADPAEPAAPAAPADPAVPADPAAEVPAGTLTVFEPTEGSTVDPTTLMFAGTGVTAGDVIAITYENEDGDTVSATSAALPVLVGTDLGWAAPATFADAADDEVSVTVTESSLLEGTVVDSVTLTITIGEASVPAFPFAVTEPAEGDTVDSYTPTVVGSAAPGEVVAVTVTNPDDLLPVIVGGGATDDAGVFTAVLDLGQVQQDEDGETAIVLDVTRVGADGALIPDNLRRVAVTFAPDDAPYVPNAPSILLVPDRITVSEAKDPLKGVRVSATGFDQNEDVQVTLVDPTGATIVFDEEALELLGGADETGTFEAPLFLFGQPALGAYTVTVAGLDSGLELTGSFELIADPAPSTPTIPTVPADSGVTPIDNPVAPVDTEDTTGTESEELAHTGSSSSPAAALAAALLLAGGALVLLRRRREGVTAR